ncbi:MAG TPA: RNA polymerase sigma factor SigE [Propionibacteriaceae bacterium]|nr:RNA polymerase sigma factor SigE [Propionibacteriaceae bacterium]
MITRSALKPAVRATPGDWTPPTWEELVQQHSAMVYRLAFRLTGNQHDAEDLTQDVFVKVFRSLHTFTPGTLEGWLHRITTNQFLDQARRRARVRIDPVADTGTRQATASGRPDVVVDDAGLAPDLARALAALPPQQRAAIVLCDVEGLSYDEVARVLDVKSGTVRSRIHRGRTAMRAALAHREPRADHERYLGVPADFVQD